MQQAQWDWQPLLIILIKSVLKPCRSVNLHLRKRALEGLKAIPKVHVLGSELAEEHTGILTFTIEDVHPHDVSAVLESDGVAVRAGHHCAQPLLEYLGVRSATRASLMFYNTEEEVDALVKSVAGVRRRMGYGE